MTPIVRAPLAAALAALMIASFAAPALAVQVLGTTLTPGTGSRAVSGVLYMRAGGVATLGVVALDAACVEVTGGITGRILASAGQTTFPFPFTAGAGDGTQTATITAWSSMSGTDCAGTSVTTTRTFELDNTGPVVTATLAPAANGAGWSNGDVAITWSATDAGSGVASGPTPSTGSQTDETDGTEHTATATDRLGNVGNGSVTVKLDRTAPTIGATADPEPNADGWNRTSVTVTFACDDARSGVATCPGPTTVTSDVGGDTVTGTAIDEAGNTSEQASASVRIDSDAPQLALVGGPSDGATYTEDTLPAAPTCDASDPLSGLAGDCSVEGYATSLGTHTVTATAHDRAGNTATRSASYTVRETTTTPTAWTLVGFGRPLGDDVNVVKGGSTVPLKFEVFDGDTELTDPDVVAAFAVEDVGCTAGRGGRGPVAFSATADKDVRYDAGTGQFEQLWQTPRTSGACYQLTLIATDGSTLTASFRTK